MAFVEFSVIGIPAPQGSKTRTPQGGFREASRRTAPWRSTVTAAADGAMHGRALLRGPLRLEVHFSYPRPKDHYRTGRFADQLKPNAPRYFCEAKDDLDKLVRAVGDAMTGYVYRDDAQIAEVAACKCWGKPAARIVVSELDREEKPCPPAIS